MAQGETDGRESEPENQRQGDIEYSQPRVSVSIEAKPVAGEAGEGRKTATTARHEDFHSKTIDGTRRAQGSEEPDQE